MQSKLSFLVLAVALVALGVAAYALVQTRSTPPDHGPGPGASREDALDNLERRVAAIEAARSREQGIPIDEGLLARLDDLDRRLKAMAAAPDEPRPSPEGPTPDTPVASQADEDEPGPEDIERFRKLQAAASRERRIQANRNRIDRALTELGITLSDDQRNQLVEAHIAFEGRRNEIWGEAKRSGAAEGPAVDWRRVIEDTNRLLVREFTERISPFIPAGDAEVISRSLQTSGK